jgi:hypothetical protein
MQAQLQQAAHEAGLLTHMQLVASSTGRNRETVLAVGPSFSSVVETVTAGLPLLGSKAGKAHAQ